MWAGPDAGQLDDSQSFERSILRSSHNPPTFRLL
jgi:hypothetical protein